MRAVVQRPHHDPVTLCVVAGFLHHRDGHHAGGHDVAHGRAGDAAHHARGHHGDLGRLGVVVFAFLGEGLGFGGAGLGRRAADGTAAMLV